MNPNTKIRKVFTSLDLGRRKPNIHIQLRYQKNSLNKILKDINILKQELFDNKSNNIFNYKFNNIIYKPKSAFKRYQNNIFDNFTSDDDDFFIKKNKNENNKDKNKVLKWNYSYYRNNHKYVFKKNYSIKKERIKKLFKLKHPDIIDDWQKPKIVKILEKNTLIEDAIITRPWKFFPCFDNNCS